MAYTIHAGPAELPNALIREAECNAAYLPGNLVAESSGQFALGATDTTGLFLIAKEKGPGVGGHVDDAYVIGDHTQAYIARQGLYFRVRVATGQALVDGETLLERGAGGQLTALAAGVAVAVARETKTTTADNELTLVEAL